jgi:hypothetical protein
MINLILDNGSDEHGEWGALRASRRMSMGNERPCELAPMEGRSSCELAPTLPLGCSSRMGHEASSIVPTRESYTEKREEGEG